MTTPDDAIQPISDEDRALLLGLIRDASALRVNDPEHRWVLALDARLTKAEGRVGTCRYCHASVHWDDGHTVSGSDGIWHNRCHFQEELRGLVERQRDAAIARASAAEARLEKAEAKLAECFRLSGADPDGNEDWRLAVDAVEEVRRLRKEFDALQDAEVERDAAQREVERLREALVGMCYQYLSVRNGKLHHDFMSAGEHAFDVLGWPNTGHPIEANCLCEVEGCGERWDAGWKDAAGIYHTTCSEHYRAALAVTPTTTTTETKKEGEG